jgi:aerobic-type carbon monoxide dehydrogenase small subunit (CoxS/CutS family)
MKIHFTLNKQAVELECDPLQTLTDLLRGRLELKSLHAGCRQGLCGQCLVLLNSHAVPSCLVPAFNLHGSTVETIEGLLSQSNFKDIELGFLKAGQNPCPSCASTKAILAESLLRNHPHLDEDLILQNLPSHWCNCSSIESFIAGVLNVATDRHKYNRMIALEQSRLNRRGTFSKGSH